MPPTSVENGLSIMRQKFATDWAAANPTVLIANENEEFALTYDANKRLDSFVRPVILISDRFQAAAVIAAAGTKMRRTIGVHSIGVFTAIGEGEGAGLSLVTSVQSILEGKNDTGVQWRAANVDKVGSTGDAYHINVNIQFYFDTFE